MKETWWALMILLKRALGQGKIPLPHRECSREPQQNPQLEKMTLYLLSSLSRQ
jgi:hypothetical protein